MAERSEMDLILGKEHTMVASARTIGLTALVVAAVTTALICFVIPGCSQIQDNSPISFSNSRGPRPLGLACSTDGSIAYVTDGRNVHRYAAADAAPAWQCILSEGERLEIAAQHDPREQPPEAQ